MNALLARLRGLVFLIGLAVLPGGILPFVHNNIEYIAVIIVAVSVVPVIIEYLRGRSKAKQWLSNT